MSCVGRLLGFNATGVGSVRTGLQALPLYSVVCCSGVLVCTVLCDVVCNGEFLRLRSRNRFDLCRLW